MQTPRGGGGVESVHINVVSVLSGFNLEKMYLGFLSPRTSKLSVEMRCQY